MANRPTFIDLRSDSQMSTSSTSRGLRSPRLHVAGDIPPELSPLDAFALQSRLLARQLEESARDGSRLSRLPPLTTSSPLVVQARSDYFRSMSQEGSPEGELPPPIAPSPGLGVRTTEVDDPFGPNRPQSVHPRMSRIPATPDGQFETRGRQLGQIDEDEPPLFGDARREQSPGALTDAGDDAQSPDRENSLNLPSPRQPHARLHHHSPDRLSHKNSFDSGLHPPRPPVVGRRPSSIMSSPLEPTDETTMAGSFSSLPPRKMSTASSSGGGGQHPHRSPSVGSESSVLFPRPSFNFSRPLSRSGTPALESHPPVRQLSSDSQPSSFTAEDMAMATPVSMHGGAFPEDRSGAPSYIYSKFDLPRGKSLQRTVPLENGSSSSSAGAGVPPSEPLPSLPPSAAAVEAAGAPPSPPTRPSTSSGAFEDPSWVPGENKNKNNPPGGPVPQPSPDPSRPSTDGGRSSEDAPRGRPQVSAQHEPPPVTPARLKTAVSATTVDTTSSTLRAARSQHSIEPSVSDMSAEEHLAKGIECHESGSLNESAYHLRRAARMNNPTAMLLYALACRHGWGMRPNQAEGVRWLKKAAEGASLEIADDEGLAKEGKLVDAVDRRTRKAQFALSVYELGVSHMNGWGVEQDKALGLRCFEIAGSWGDVDALAEAGFCYAKGVGCKKDLKKAAKFYRSAEAKGMSMIGNSWIHKAKYNDNEADRKKRARSKSRTRTMFGLKG